MRSLSTPFVETNALLAALEGNTARLREITDGMTNVELAELADACDLVETIIGEALKGRRENGS